MVEHGTPDTSDVGSSPAAVLNTHVAQFGLERQSHKLQVISSNLIVCILSSCRHVVMKTYCIWNAVMGV